MKKIIKEIKLYNFDELSDNSKNVAIKSLVDFIIDTTDFSKIDKHTNLYKAYKKCEELKTPWFIENFVWEYCKKDILKNLKKRFFLENGEVE